MNSADVLIVGGGPAGSTLARALTLEGLDVVVLDKADFPRDKVCAGWITPEVVHSLELDLPTYGSEHVLQPIHSLRIGIIGGDEIETRPRAEPISFGIRRVEFDTYLLRRSGARLRLGQPLRSMRRDGLAWRINDEIRARLVVGAGGHFCPVARLIGASAADREPAVLAQEVEFHLGVEQRHGCRVDPFVPQLLFCPDLAGYGWVLRKGNWINIGLGRQDPRRLPDHVAAFRRFLVDTGRIPPDAPDRFRGHAYLLYTDASRPVRRDGVLLIGDAAGLAYPESGEGIRPAVESALLAARVIVEAAGDYGAGRLGRYVALLEQRLGRRRPRRSPAALLPQAWRRAAARRLLSTEWFARRFVQDRWFLHTDQPALRQGVAGDGG